MGDLRRRLRGMVLLAVFGMTGLAVLLFAGPSSAEAQARLITSPTSTQTQEAKAVQEVIARQISAFLSDDADTAFSFAADRIKAQFGTPQNFMAMVARGYAAIYRPKTFEFGEFTKRSDLYTQEVILVDENDRRFLANYWLMRNEDGLYRIAGCIIRELKEQRL